VTTPEINDGQANTQVEAAVGQNVPDAPEVGDNTDDGTEELDDAEVQDDDEQQDGGRRNREAHYRRRAQTAETERDQLRAQLDTVHRQMVGDIATAAGLPEVELLESAGHELASFITEAGAVDRAKVTEATTETMRRYNIRRRGTLASNPQQGLYSAPPVSSGVAGVINEALGR
jgi:hypothetical protein